MDVCSRVRVVTATAAVVLGMATTGFAEQEEDDDFEIIDHEVQDHETVGTVALEHEVNVVELMEWNDLESVCEVDPGEQLEIKIDPDADEASGPSPVLHRVSRGDTFEGIARRYGVTISQLRQWNRNVNPRRLQIGDHIHLNIPGPDEGTVSWGRASQGRLFNGIPMESSPGLRVRNVHRAYGTEYTVNMLQAAGADVQARWPDAPELVVGSISLQNGGPMRPHRSHQSGRDADLSYYHRGNVETEDFLDMSPEKFDAVKNWHFFKTLIATGEVEYIFVDYELQEVLYEYAVSAGYDEETLDELLQYPRGRRANRGIIRHSPGHANHFHIRFRCTDQDQNCR